MFFLQGAQKVSYIYSKFL